MYVQTTCYDQSSREYRLINAATFQIKTCHIIHTLVRLAKYHFYKMLNENKLVTRKTLL